MRATREILSPADTRQPCRAMVTPARPARPRLAGTMLNRMPLSHARGPLGGMLCLEGPFAPRWQDDGAEREV
ncbi:hypothetical protein C4N9_16940 [Pararhodobacter marinus]|uniref:Uncharacterized protein n=1 Tax=Pararhodobacter marinus TaxID=2184063 RepID=A0A2U2C620_9RHOB|nr:hypothetical protein C4N9_16940 [Pararhodobacter marinus]